jgi:hypothetical protein
MTSLTRLLGVRDVLGESIVSNMQALTRKYFAISLDQRGEAWCNLRARAATVHAVQPTASMQEHRCRGGPSIHRT